MTLLIILMVLQANGMYIPTWAAGFTWAMLVFEVLSIIPKLVEIFLTE